MNNFSDELYHYGVKGMKWGIRRTLEELGHRPSSKKKKTKEDKALERKQKKAEKVKKALSKKRARERKKRQAILNNPSRLYRHRKEFSKDEIDAALKQFEWEKKLDGYSLYRLESGKRAALAILGTMSAVTGIGKTGEQVWKMIFK